MLRYAVLFFAMGLASGFDYQDLSPPRWDSSYKVEAEIYYPLADVKETATIWFDAQNGRTQVDYYGGTTRNYHYSSPSNPISISVFPSTSGIEQNPLVCHIQVGRHVEADNSFLLPDLIGYRFQGTENLLGKNASIWEVNGKMEQKTMWVQYEMDLSGHLQAIPLRFEVKRLEHQRSKTLKHEYIDYSNYEVLGDAESIRNNFIVFDMPCKLLIRQHEESLEDMFSDFKSRHQIEYTSEDEHDYRQRIFEQNLRNIEAHNRAGRGFKLAVNHLADRTPEELALRTGLLYPGHMEDSGRPFPYNLSQVNFWNTAIPKEWDWRLRGAVTPVKDQLYCGSCWAFSAVGAVEGALRLHSNQPVERLSEQALMDCSWGRSLSRSNLGCLGGNLVSAFEWIKNHGLPKYLDYGGYLGKNGQCHHENMTDTVTISGYVTVPPFDEKALQLAIFKHGPVSAPVDANGYHFQFYSEGVFESEEPEYELNHAVLVVGYGVQDGKRYWLVKNSWGSSWGVNGYILMAANRNTLGILHSPVYVTFD